MWNTVPNLRHLRAFRLAAESGSVSEAARNIHLSQPAVTQALSSLQVQVGVRLLEFGTAGMAVTDVGRLFQDRVARALDLLDEGAREAIRLSPARTRGGFANFAPLLTVAQLRALSAMSRTGNFSLAARDVGLSQPSIHRAARDLERLTGLSLFEATRQGFELSRAAEALARHAHLAHAELEQGFAEIAEYLGRDSGQIVIGSLPFARTSLLPDALNALTRLRPHVQVRVISAPYDGLLHRLRHGIIDFLVGALREPLPIDDVEQERLFDDPLAIVARAGHPLVALQAVSHADLLAYPWVVPGPETPTRQVFEQMFTADELARMPGGVIETSSLVLVRGVLAGSDRLTILSARQAQYELDQGLLAVVPVSLGAGMRSIGLTTRVGWKPTAAQRVLLHALGSAKFSL